MGLSLLLIGLTSAVLGYYQEGSKPPLGSVAIGAYRESAYTFFVIGITASIMLVLYLGLKRTRFGLLARGTMQNPAMAAGLGVDTAKIYAATFGLGAALSGLAGGILAPISGVVPVIGTTYTPSLYYVISGGATVSAGAHRRRFAERDREGQKWRGASWVRWRACRRHRILLRLLPLASRAGCLSGI
jgi:branched-chain amino acid transport system permease protein